MTNQWCAQKLTSLLKTQLQLKDEELPSNPNRLESWLNWPSKDGGKYFLKIACPPLLYDGDIIFNDPLQDYIAIVLEGGSVTGKYKVSEADSSIQKLVIKEKTGPVQYVLRWKGAFNENTSNYRKPNISQFSAGTGTGNITYQLAGKKRSLPIQKKLENILQGAAEEVGVNLIVTSGGQLPGKGTGSTRHNYGYAADFVILNGSRAVSCLPGSPDIPLLQQFVKALRRRGSTGIGMAPGYMGPSVMHADIAYPTTINVPPICWGVGGRSANAPQWLKDAF